MAVSVGTIYATLALRDKLSKPLSAAGAKLGRFGKMAGAGLAVGATAAAAAIAAIGVAAAKSVSAASDFESSFAGVRKTVEGTEAEFQALAAGFRAMSKEIPVSVNELNKIGESAGQLGVKKADILEFTRTMADLGVTTNLSADAAATSLARMANIMDNEAGPQYERMGSTIVQLGNNLATTEAEIVNFGLRIAGAGKLAGLSEAQIFSIGGAMSSIGVAAEAGGTSVQKVLNKMTQAVATNSEELGVFAQTAGMTAKQFSQAFKEDAGEAFTVFVEGIKTQGEGAFKTLEDLSLENERVIRSFLGLAGAGDLLRTAMEQGARGWEENTAMAKEAEQRYATFQSQVQILKNIFNDIAIAIGQVMLPVLNTFVGSLGDAAKKSSFATKVVSAFTGTLKFMARVLQVLNPIWQALKLAVILIAAPMIAGIKNFYAMAEGLAGLYMWIGKGIGSFKVMGIVLDALKSVGSKVVDFFLKIIDSIVEFTSDIPVVGKLVKNTTDSFKTMGSAIKSSVVDTISFNDSMNGMVDGLTESNDVANKGITAQNDLDAAFSQSDEGLKELNETLEQTGEQQEQVVESTEEVKDEFADMVAQLRGDGLVKQIEILQGSYERLTEKGELTAKEHERFVAELIKVRDAGGDIPEAFAGMIESYEKAEAGARATKEETARLQGVYDRFSMEGPRQSAADLEAAFLKLKSEGELNEAQLEMFGKAAIRLQEEGITTLGAGLDGLALQYGDHTVEKIPSLREALKTLGEGFEAMAVIGGESFKGVIKKAGETVAKIEVVMATVDTLKATYKKLNDFFVGGGWKSMTDAFSGVVGWFKKLKTGAGGVDKALGATKLVSDGLGKSVTEIGGQSTSTALKATASFSSMAAGMAAAAAVAVTLWAVIRGGPNAKEMAAQRTKWIEAGGDKAESTRRRALADLQTLQRAKYAPDAIPLQHGGIVTQPTVGLLGEAGAEAVIPLDKMGAMGDEQLLTEMRGLRSELRLLPLHLRDAILLAQ